MKKYFKIILMSFVFFVVLYTGKCFAGGTATFVQLHRGDALRTVEEWENDMSLMRAIGIDTVIVQWTSFGDVLYLESDKLRYREQYPVIDRIMEAAARKKMDIYLGLSADDLYWNNATLKKTNLEDYFLLRVSLNFKMAQVLKERFDVYKNWKGFYITEEIDDKTWRGKRAEKLIGYYVEFLSRKLKFLDKDREILISVFFRLRTEPGDFAENMKDILALTLVDRILLQDGVGVDIKNLKFVPLYFEEMVAAFGKDKIWGVLEAFTQTGKDSEFVAEPALYSRVEKQLDSLSKNCAKIAYFSFLDYMHPEKDIKANALYTSFIEVKKTDMKRD